MHMFSLLGKLLSCLSNAQSNDFTLLVGMICREARQPWSAIPQVAMWFYFFFKITVELPEVMRFLPQAELDARVLQNQTYLTVDTMSEIIDPVMLNSRINEVLGFTRLHCFTFDP